jgi:single-strand DNA-binding protein
MAGDINQVVLVGRLTRDAELKYTSSGIAICTFAVAVNRRIRKGEQWLDEASFFDLTLWDKQAEGLQKYLLKGTQVAVQGELRQDRWEKDGQKFSKIQVFVNNLELLGSRSGGRDEVRGAEAPAPYKGTNSSKPSAPPSVPEFDPQSYEDDIPF